MTTTIEGQEKRQLIDLALAAAKKYESPRTGLIHYCMEDENSRDTIPFYHNFCHCLALLRSLVPDYVQEGMERLNHLLSFQDENGYFPTYLHEYPNSNPYSRSLFPLKLIEKHFGHILGSAIRSKLKTVAPLPAPPDEILSSKDGARKALYLDSLESLSLYWDPDLQIYRGPLNDERQRGGDIDLTLFDLFMANAKGIFSPRILKPHPIHLQAALVFPTNRITHFSTMKYPSPIPHGKGYHLFRNVWKEEDTLHTLVCQEKKMRLEDDILIYPEEIPDEKHRTELSFFVNHHPSNALLINGEKGTVFRFGDKVEIGKRFSLSFEKIEGEGDFLGHISRGNRPAQIDPDIYTAHDWKISIRTLRRTPNLKLKLSLL